jgi:hypothetical protein
LAVFEKLTKLDLFGAGVTDAGPILAIQFATARWDAPAELKFLLVAAATMAVLLASYEWGVRYTFIGAILNGRKYKAKAAPSPVAPVSVPAAVAA